MGIFTSIEKVPEPKMSIDLSRWTLGTPLLLDILEGSRAKLWFTVEDDGDPRIVRAGNAEMGFENDLAYVEEMFGDDWRVALGIESWYDLMQLGLAPGQTFRVELHAKWSRSGYDGYEDWDVDVTCKVIERTSMNPYDVLRAWGSVLTIMGDGAHLLPGDKYGEMLDLEAKEPRRP